MPWQALVLVLLAALAHWCTFRLRLPVCALRAAGRAHAAWNIGAKKVGGGTHFVLMGALFVGVLWAPLGLWLAVQEVPQWAAAQCAAVLASALLHLVYYRTLLRGYREADLTVVYPVARGSAPLLSSAAAVLLLGEPAGWGLVAGVAMMALGVFLIAGGPALWRRAHDPLQRTRLRAGLLWGALTGALTASYTVLDGFAVKLLLVSPIVLDYIGNLLRIPLMLPAAWRERATAARDWRMQWKVALLGAVLGPLAYVLVLYAMRLAPLSHVAPAREVSMLFAALLGGHMLGEADRGARLLGALAMAAGVVLLVVG